MLPPFVTKVGVFVDDDPARIREIVDAVRLDAVQLHGSEPPEYVSALLLPVIKAIRVKDASSLHVLRDYRVRAFLLDTYDASALGGTGATFDWTLAARAAQTHRVILSGGLTPGNVADALTRVRPYGVDVSSGVETNGRKDHGKIRAFIRRVREWDFQHEHAVGSKP